MIKSKRKKPLFESVDEQQVTLILFEMARVSPQDVLDVVNSLFDLLKYQLNVILMTRRSLSLDQQEFTEWTEKIAFIVDMRQNLI